MELGLTHESTIIVSEKDSAIELGSGDLKVFATPSMIRLMENAAMLSVSDHLPEGDTTVGTNINVDHKRASKIGAKIVAKATLKEIDGARLLFDVIAYDNDVVIGEGTHTRYVVNVERFLERL